MFKNARYFGYISIPSKNQFLSTSKVESNSTLAFGVSCSGSNMLNVSRINTQLILLDLAQYDGVDSTEETLNQMETQQCVEVSSHQIVFLIMMKGLFVNRNILFFSQSKVKSKDVC